MFQFEPEIELPARMYVRFLLIFSLSFSLLKSMPTLVISIGAQRCRLAIFVGIQQLLVKSGRSYPLVRRRKNWAQTHAQI